MFEAVTDRAPTAVENRILGGVGGSAGRGERAGSEQGGQERERWRAADRHRIEATYEQIAQAEALVAAVSLAARTGIYALLVLWAHRAPVGVQVLTGALLADFVGWLLRSVLFWEKWSARTAGEVVLYGVVLQLGLLSQEIPVEDSVVEGRAVVGLAFLAVFALRVAAVVRERLGPETG